MPPSLVRREAAKVDRVLAVWDRGVAPRTALTRREHLARFGAFAFGENDARLAATRLLALTHADAIGALGAWARAMVKLGHAERTRTDRILAVQAFARVAHSLGACSWSLRLPTTREPAEVPSAAEVENAIADLGQRGRRRDLAVVLLAYDAMLAYGEIVALRVRDVDFGNGSVLTPKRRVGLTARTIAALREAIDGDDADPLFVGARGGELSAMSAWRIFRALGLGSPDCVRRAGLEAHPQTAG